MPYAILNTKKIKTQSEINGASHHNCRTRETLNADPEKKNEIIVDGGPDLFLTITNRIRTFGIHPRKNSVLAQELNLSVSPDYFRPTEIQKAGFYDEQKMRAWRDITVEWLYESFQQNIVECILHLDESTPHIHSIVIPMTKDNRLSAYEIFSKITLQKMQSTYAAVLEPLGIDRGITGTKATHLKIKEFYSSIVASYQMEKSLPLIEAPAPMLSEDQCLEYAQNYNRVFQKKMKPVFDMASFAGYAVKKREEYQKRCVQLSREVESLKERLALAPSPLTMSFVLERFGLEKISGKKDQWVGRGCRISLLQDGRQNSFIDTQNNISGAGVLSLVMCINKCSLKEALVWVKTETNLQDTVNLLRIEAEKIANQLTAGQRSFFELPDLHDNHTDLLHKYLLSLRISANLTESLLAEKMVYASQTPEGDPISVFVCKNAYGPTGAEIEGLTKKISGMYKYSDRQTGAFSIGNEKKQHLVICQNAIEAISYHELHLDLQRFVISTAGLTVYPPFLDKSQENEWKVTVAYGNNENGETFTREIQKRFPEIKIETPTLETWNDDLQETVDRLEKLTP